MRRLVCGGPASAPAVFADSAAGSALSVAAAASPPHPRAGGLPAAKSQKEGRGRGRRAGGGGAWKTGKILRHLRRDLKRDPKLAQMDQSLAAALHRAGVCVCVCARARARMRACVRVLVCERESVCVSLEIDKSLAAGLPGFIARV